MDREVTWDVTKEVNKINDWRLTDDIMGQSINLLRSQNFISDNDIPNLGVDFAYLYQRDNGVLEGLFKVFINNSNKVFPMALQENKLKVLNINDTQYKGAIDMMLEMHPCLRQAPEETPIQRRRKEKNNSILRTKNIEVSKSLKCIYNDDEIVLKSKEEICKRAIASLLVIQLSYDARTPNYNSARDYVNKMLENYGVTKYVNAKEYRILTGNYTEQDLIDMDWAYEAYWSICWCLGLVRDITDASTTCDCNYAINLVASSSNFDDFFNKCNLRSKEEILDMEDLYLRYTWAINEKKINNRASIGNLIPSNVIERRRGLEWVISPELDWYNVYLGA